MKAPGDGAVSERQAGRELDVIVAELMGATWHHEPEWPGGPVDYLKFPSGKGGVLVERRCSDGREMIPAGCPHYSTDISAAFAVVGKIIEVEGVSFVRLGTDGEEWLLEINPDDPEPWTTYEEHAADTAPLAICLAALRAREGVKR